MSKVQMLNALVKQRLTAAAEEIFGLFERTIAEYEEERCRSKEENERQRKLLDAVFNPQLRLRKTDVHQLSASKEIERGSLQRLEGADITKFPLNLQQDTENQIGDSSEPATGDSGGCRVNRAARSGLKSLEKDDAPVGNTRRRTGRKQLSCSKCTKIFGVKSSLKRHMRTHTVGKPLEDCEGPEPARNLDLDRHPEPKTDDQTGDSSEPETDDSEDQEETAKAQANLKSLKKDDVPVSDTQCSTGKKEFSCSKCTKRFGFKSSLKRHMRTHTVKKCFSCSVCKKSFQMKSLLQRHMTIHTGEKAFRCSVCKKGFNIKSHLQRHMIIHTGEKAFGCSVCKKRFGYKATLQQHMATHTGEKRLRCSVCDQRFTWHSQLRKHRRVCCKPSRLRQRQTEQMEKEADGEDRGGPGPARKSDPRRHSEPKTDDQTGDSSEPETDDSEDQEETTEAQSSLKSLEKDDVPVSNTRRSTGKKEFSCSKCTKRFDFKSVLKRHMRTHLVEKLVHCSVCKRDFRRESHLQAHMITHTGEKPFRCSVCKQRFAWSCNLKRHMRTHRGSKRLRCRV